MADPHLKSPAPVSNGLSTAPQPAASETNRRSGIPGIGRHLTVLDGLRGLAVLFVLVFHIFQVEVEPADGLGRIAYKAMRVGQTGVDLFFVLSGFLITGILQDSKHAANYFRNFYGRRTLRIFPLYYGTLIVATIIIPLLIGRRITDSNPFMLWTFTANMQGMFNFDPQTFGHFWTLAVEEQFYLIWPAVVLMFARPSMMKVCIACIFGAIFVRIGLLSMGLSANFFMPGRLDSLAVGGFLALAARGETGIEGWNRKALATLVAMIMLVGPFYVMKTGTHEQWLQVIKYTLLAVLFGALLAVVLSAKPNSVLAKFFNSRILRCLGKYSYGLYVFHPFMIDAFMAARRSDPTGAMETFGGPWLRVPVIIVLSLIASWLSWHMFEKHFMGLKRYFAYDTDAPRVETQPNTGRAGTLPGTA